MANPARPTRKNLQASATASFNNGSRLLDERYSLEFAEHYATRFYNAMIAQEEFAKASCKGPRPLQWLIQSDL